MSLRRIAAIARNDLRLLRSDPGFLIVLTLMPLVVMAFIKPVFDAGQVVPGMAVMFSMFLVGNLGFSVFREHGWNTWERLRASWASPGEILVGKSVTPLMCLVLQLTILFGVGGVLFGLHVRGSFMALALVALSYAICLLALGSVLLALCRTLMQLNGLTNLGAMVLAGLAGALTPFALLPVWARAIAPATPGYWAMRGFREVITGGAGLRAVMVPCSALLGAAVVLGSFALWRFRFDETKLGWA